MFKIMNSNFNSIMDGIQNMEAAIEFVKGYIALVNTSAEKLYIVDTASGEIRKVMIINGRLKISARE